MNPWKTHVKVQNQRLNKAKAKGSSCSQNRLEVTPLKILTPILYQDFANQQ